VVMSRSIYWRLTIPQFLHFKPGFVLTHEFLFFCMRIAVHFWAPTFKWGISIANIADFAKPPEKVSYPQQMGMKPNTFFLSSHLRRPAFLTPDKDVHRLIEHRI
jgi:hypothetical protein